MSSKTKKYEVVLPQGSDDEIIGSLEEYLRSCKLDSFRGIAKRQIASLLRRRNATRNYALYDREIQKVIQCELERLGDKDL